RLSALAAPTATSSRRLVPGFEAPVNLVYSQRNRSAAVRIPVYSKSEKSKRIEFRCPDTAANPYLCFSALLMAGLDGVKNKIDPGEPADFDLYEASAEELARIKSTPGSLGDVLCALQADHAFLLEGGVFTEDLIETWISYKQTNELAPVNLRPTPSEFSPDFEVYRAASREPLAASGGHAASGYHGRRAGRCWLVRALCCSIIDRARKEIPRLRSE